MDSLNIAQRFQITQSLITYAIPYFRGTPVTYDFHMHQSEDLCNICIFNIHIQHDQIILSLMHAVTYYEFYYLLQRKHSKNTRKLSTTK